MSDEATIRQIDREAATRLLGGHKVGAGDGHTYVTRQPSYQETCDAFARRAQAERDAVVAYLRNQISDSRRLCDDGGEAIEWAIVDIERGDHHAG